MSLGEYDPCLTDWLGSLKSTTPCRLLSDLPKSAGDHRSDSRTDRSESGYARCRRLFDVVSTALCAGIEDEFTLMR